jgi:hypothetical protein
VCLIFLFLLFSSGTLSKDINFDLALKYHAGVGANDRASDVGLGWSLFAGGSVSRTVRGLPDEIYFNTVNEQKIGIHHNTNTNVKNNYYYFIQNIVSQHQNDYKPLNTLTPQDINIGNEFLWEVANTNKYDTEHDLWQFNFMGNTGRFFIKKNLLTNQLEIIPLDDYRVRIFIEFETINNNPYIPKNLIIYDTNGIKYIFDIKEISRNKFSSSNTYAVEESNINFNGFSVGTQTTQSVSADKDFISSFHLSKIFDSNDNLIMEYIYDNANNYVESFTNMSFTKNEIDRDMMASFNQCKSFPPLESITNSSTTVKIKKIDYIDVKGFSKIYFEYIKGRNDSNINLKTETAFLKSITIKDVFFNDVKKYQFDYTYSVKPDYVGSRMMLNKIEEVSGSQLLLKNSFYYKNNTYDDTLYQIGKDYWGYFNLFLKCENTTKNHRKVSPDYCTTDLLEKIIHATKGTTVFEFESNNFSYDGSQELTNFSEDNENLDLVNTKNIILTNHIFTPINISNYKKVIFNSGIVIYDLANATQSVGLFKKVGNLWVSADVGLHCFDNNCCVVFFPEPNVEYAVKFSELNAFNQNMSVGLNIKCYNYNGNQFFYGGGNRIKNIKYYDKNLSDNASLNISPVKQKNFNYNFFNTNKSSGSLVSRKPAFSFVDYFGFGRRSYSVGEDDCNHPFQTTGYFSDTNSNFLIPIKTSGSDVGYQNITVYEEELGKIEYVYTSPIDFPEQDLFFSPPFITSKNYDYKRGLLKRQVTYNNEIIPKILNEVSNLYDFENYQHHTGTKFRNPVGQCYTGTLFTKYSDYINKLFSDAACMSCNTGSYMMLKNKLCGLPLDAQTPKITFRPIYEAYGWSKLASKTTKNYFYPNGGNTPNIVTSNETFTYNSLNKQIATHTVSNSVGETLTTNYFYHTGNSPFSQNRISEIERIETKNGTTLLSESKINYSNTFAGNQSFLPSSIEVKKGNSPSEIRLRNNAYDAFGHVLEVQQESGMKISYIYGYNNTQPVAKLENIAYANIPANLISAIQNASNGTVEIALSTALNNLRTALPSAMITTLTYKPLLGVSTVTDPKGDKQTYHYDSFNRLEFVKDSNGNILSENKYHYKN